MRKLPLALSALVVILLSPQAMACTMFPPHYVVNEGFVIQVRDSLGNPMPSVPIRIDAESKSVGVFRTDGLGRVSIKGLTRGRYSVKVGDMLSDYFDIEVKRSAKSIDLVGSVWPHQMTVESKRLEGVVRMGMSDMKAMAALPGMIQLLSPFTGTKLDSVRIGEDGHFAFGETTPGLYFIKLDIRGEEEAVVAVRLNPSSKKERLELETSLTSCGAGLSQICDQGQIVVPLLTGTVTDPAGAVIQAAEITVFDAKGRTVVRLSSGPEGSFTAPTLAAGNYRLEITAPGFSRWISRLVVSPGLERQASPTFVLSVAGFECTTAPQPGILS